MQSVEIDYLSSDKAVASRKLEIVVVAICAGVLGCDLLALNFPSIGIVGAALYASLAMLLVGTGLLALLTLELELFRGRAICTFFTLIVIAITIFSQITSPASLSEELTLEIACIREHLAHSLDSGFHGGCLYEYPARQFIFPALPSLIFGPTQFALNFGVALLVSSGFIIFGAGVYRRFGSSFCSDALASILLISMFHAPMFLHILFLYEQSVFPAALTFAAVGFWIGIAQRPQLRSALVLLCTIQLSHTYTTALAPVALALAYFCHQVFARRTGDTLLVFAIACLSVAVSIAYRGDLRLIGAPDQISERMLEAWHGLSAYFADTLNPNPLHSFATFIFMLGTIAALFGALGAVGFFAALWVLATLALSAGTLGYTNYGIFYRLHRAAVAYPVMLALTGLTILPSLHTLSKRAVVGVLCMISLGSIYFGDKFLSERAANRHLEWYNWASDKLPSGHASIFFSSSVASQYLSTNDLLSYFNPAWRVSTLAPNCTSSQISDQRDVRPVYFMLQLNEREICQEALSGALELLYEQPYQAKDQPRLYLFKLAGAVKASG